MLVYETPPVCASPAPQQFVSQLCRAIVRASLVSSLLELRDHLELHLALLLVEFAPVLADDLVRVVQLGYLGQGIVALHTSKNGVTKGRITRTRSMVLAFSLLASEHHVSHQSHSCGSEKIGTCICKKLGRSWSRFARLPGSRDSES